MSKIFPHNESNFCGFKELVGGFLSDLCAEAAVGHELKIFIARKRLSVFSPRSHLDVNNFSAFFFFIVFNA